MLWGEIDNEVRTIKLPEVETALRENTRQARSTPRPLG